MQFIRGGILFSRVEVFYFPQVVLRYVKDLKDLS